MKKLVSLFLSLVLVAVSVTCSLVLATANNGEQQSLGLAANWRLYENKTATIGETGILLTITNLYMACKLAAICKAF